MYIYNNTPGQVCQTITSYGCQIEGVMVVENKLNINNGDVTYILITFSGSRAFVQTISSTDFASLNLFRVVVRIG